MLFREMIAIYSANHTYVHILWPNAELLNFKLCGTQTTKEKHSKIHIHKILIGISLLAGRKVTNYTKHTVNTEEHAIK
jgi:hypothetical protein